MSAQPEPQRVHYEFDEATVDLILEGLGHLPYRRVARAMEQIAAIARATLYPQPVKRARKPPAPKA